MISSVFCMLGLRFKVGYGKEFYSHIIGKKRADRQLDGEQHDGFPTANTQNTNQKHGELTQ